MRLSPATRLTAAAVAAIVPLTLASCTSQSSESAGRPPSSSAPSVPATSSTGGLNPAAALLLQSELPAGFSVTELNPNFPAAAQVDAGTTTFEPADCGPARNRTATPPGTRIARLVAISAGDAEAAGRQITEAVSTAKDDIAAIRDNVTRCSDVTLTVLGGVKSQLTRVTFDAAEIKADEIVTYEERSTSAVTAPSTTLVATANVGSYSITVRSTDHTAATPDRAAFTTLAAKAVDKARTQQ